MSEALDREMYDLSTAVIVARKHDEALRGILRDAREEWEREHAELLADVKACEEKRKAAEAALRTAGLARYRMSGEKKVAPGIAIRIVSKAKYKPERAFEWAKAHRMALKLDAAVFEKLVKSGVVDQGVAAMVEEPQATIATDLESAVLEDVLTRFPKDALPAGWTPVSLDDVHDRAHAPAVLFDPAPSVDVVDEHAEIAEGEWTAMEHGQPDPSHVHTFTSSEFTNTGEIVHTLEGSHPPVEPPTAIRSRKRGQ